MQNLSPENPKSDFLSLEVQFNELLVLFDKAVASAIDVGAEQSTRFNPAVVRDLDDSLFEFRMWLENAEAHLPKEIASSDLLKILDGLSTPTAATIHSIFLDLKANLTDLMDSVNSINSSLEVTIIATCDKIKTSVDSLDRLQEELSKELAASASEVRRMMDENYLDSTTKISVLSFDGGGVRSYSSLLILVALMNEIRSVVGTLKERSSIKPYDVFKYIFGSSSGGLIAIMLARLKMTERQSADAFSTYAENIFRHHSSPRNALRAFGTSKYSSARLLRAVKLVIGSFDPSPKSQKWKRNMFAAPAEHCRCGVIAYAKPSDPDQVEVPHIFRTYDNPLGTRNPGAADDSQIWQVAYATAAAPLLFPPAKIDGREYIDGGFGATNNPSHEVSRELSTLHPTSTICLVSIGSGRKRDVSRFPKTLPGLGRFYTYLRFALSYATDTTITHENMMDLAARSETFTYFRFDVPNLQDILMDEWQAKSRERSRNPQKMHTREFIEKETYEYLSRTETRAMIVNCARTVVETYWSQLKSLPRQNKADTQRLFGVPARNNGFRGREEMIERIYQCLRCQTYEEASRLRVCSLTGLGGMGKTELAVEYIYQYRNEYQYVFWVQAHSEAGLKADYSSIAALHKGTGVGPTLNVDEDVQAARRWLSNSDADWLLVFDDVQDVSNVLPYIPTNTHGSILITSRRQFELSGSVVIFIEPMDQSSGLALLDSIISDQGDDDQKRSLAALFGGYPLAIVQERGPRLLGNEKSLFPSLNFGKSLSNAWDISLESLSANARSLLECMAFLGPDMIPEILFIPPRKDHLPAYLDVSFEKFRELHIELQDVSLIRRDPQTQGFSMHKVVKLHVLWKLTMEPKRHLKVFLEVYRLIRAVVPLEPSPFQPTLSPSDTKNVINYVPQLMSLHEQYRDYDRSRINGADDLDYIELVYDMGTYLMTFPTKESLGIATEWLHLAFDRRNTLLGQKHPDTLRSMIGLAMLCRIQGQWSEAEKLNKQIIEIGTSLLGAEYPDTLRSMAMLAESWRMQGRMIESEELIRRVVHTQNDLGNEGLEGLRSSMLILVDILQGQERWEEAEDLNKQVIEDLTNALGEKHQSTLTGMALLVKAHQHRKKLDEAEDVNIKVLKGRRDLLGELHPDTLGTKAIQVKIYHGRARLDHARDLCQQVFDEAKMVLGEESPLTLSIMADLAQILWDQGISGEAIALLTQNVDLRKKALGVDDPETLDAMANLEKWNMEMESQPIHSSKESNP